MKTCEPHDATPAKYMVCWTNLATALLGRGFCGQPGKPEAMGRGEAKESGGRWICREDKMVGEELCVN